MVSIEKSVTVSFRGKQKWHIKGNMMFEIDGCEFVKLPPYDYGLVHLVAEGCVDTKGYSQLSLSQPRGYEELMQLRSDAAMVAPTPEVS